MQYWVVNDFAIHILVKILTFSKFFLFLFSNLNLIFELMMQFYFKCSPTSMDTNIIFGKNFTNYRLWIASFAISGYKIQYKGVGVYIAYTKFRWFNRWYKAMGALDGQTNMWNGISIAVAMFTIHFRKFQTIHRADIRFRTGRYAYVSLSQFTRSCDSGLANFSNISSSLIFAFRFHWIF